MEKHKVSKYPLKCEGCGRHVPVYDVVPPRFDNSVGWYCKRCIKEVENGEVDRGWLGNETQQDRS